jgi:hypothetical protein
MLVLCMKFILLALLTPALALAAPKPLFQSKLVDTNTPSHGAEIDVSVEGAKRIWWRICRP